MYLNTRMNKVMHYNNASLYSIYFTVVFSSPRPLSNNITELKLVNFLR